MKIGYIGVGKWAAQLKAAFEARGHETVGYIRKNYTAETDGWGRDLHYARIDEETGDYEEGPIADLLVVTCPHEAAHIYAQQYQHVPMLVTKPFDPTCVSRTAPTYVDLWRVLTPEWEEFKASFRSIKRHGTIGVAIDAMGKGPYRSWLSGSMDYAPHAMAYLLDMFSTVSQSKLTWAMSNGLDGISAEYGVIFGSASVKSGNNSDKKRFGVTVHYRTDKDDDLFLEFNEPSKSVGLAKLVEHCETGNPYTWELNKRVQWELRNVPWVVR